MINLPLSAGRQSLSRLSLALVTLVGVAAVPARADAHPIGRELRLFKLSSLPGALRESSDVVFGRRQIASDGAQDWRGGNAVPLAHLLGRRPADAVVSRVARLDSLADHGWCERVAAGSPGQSTVAQDLSVAANVVREFSVVSAFGNSDSALAAALVGAGSPASADVVATYAAALADTCGLDASQASLGPANVTRIKQTAIVKPGIGPVVIPPDTRQVVIDLRNLPGVAGLRAALERAVAPALFKPVARPSSWARIHHGPVDEVLSASNVYRTSVSIIDHPAYPASGPRDVPLIFLTGSRMAPEASEFAGAFRMAGRAALLGEDVFASVAEVTWRGVANRGVAVRTQILDRIDSENPPQVSRGVKVAQNDLYVKDIDVVDSDTHILDVSVDGRPGVDLDLYVLYDANGDQAFDFPSELISYSAGPSADERVRLAGMPTPGRYQVWVFGYDAGKAGTTVFDLTTSQISGQIWPDVITADARLTNATMDEIASTAASLAKQHLDPTTGPVNRDFIEYVNPFGASKPVVTGKPELRAALLIAHGMVRRFYPYFDVVGDDADSRLSETLELVEGWDGTDRTRAREILQRFGQVLRDGHQFVFDGGPSVIPGFLPVFPEDIGGRPVIRRSTSSAIRAGDAILSIDGAAIEDVYSSLYELTSAATRGYQFDLASRKMAILKGTATLDLLDPRGELRTVSIDPQPLAAYFEAALPGESGRPSGPLGDVGAPNLYYLNMDTLVSPTGADVSAAIQDAVSRNAAGLVLDMRGYPGGNHYEAAMRLIQQPFLSPQYIVSNQTGPDDATPEMSQYLLGPISGPAWTGPIVLLTGPHAVSAAENFMQMLVWAGRLQSVAGRSSAGTNGNITGVQLPGGFQFTYTGMKVLNPDGSRFHGIGIVPDVAVGLTASALAAGEENGVAINDETLLRAVAVLQ